MYMRKDVQTHNRLRQVGKETSISWIVNLGQNSTIKKKTRHENPPRSLHTIQEKETEKEAEKGDKKGEKKATLHDI